MMLMLVVLLFLFGVAIKNSLASLVKFGFSSIILLHE